MKNAAPVFDIEKARSRMEQAGIDLILASSKVNTGYLSGLYTHVWGWDHAILHALEKEYDGWDYLIFVGLPQNSSQSQFMVEYHHRTEALRDMTWIQDIKGYSRNGYQPPPNARSLFLEPKKAISQIDCVVEAIEERGLSDSTIGIEENRLPLTYFNALQKRLQHAKFVYVFDLLFELRSVKTPEEIRRLRRAYKINEQVYREIFENFQVGVTPYHIFQRTLETVYREGAAFVFNHVFFEGQEAAYNVPADQPILPGQSAFYDFGLAYEGYKSDTARTIVNGTASEDLKHVYRAVLETYHVVQEALKPGVRASEVFRLGSEYLESKQLCPSITCLGHGIGLNQHEMPFLTPHDHTVIEPGMVITIEPNAEAPGLTPCFVEDAGVITIDGWENFTALPTTLQELI